MPNHVTNILKFVGPQDDIDILRARIKSVDEQGYKTAIDFNKIIPMPQTLNITSGSLVDRGIAILKFTEKGDDSELRAMLNYPWVKAENITTPQQLVDHFLKGDDGNRGYLTEARMALENIEKYGHKDWYSWSIANWGTKWNAYETSDDEDSIKFDTAWSTPAPIVEKLSEMFPTVTIILEFADEDFGHNCGSIVFLAGNVMEENIPQGGSAEAYALAARIQSTDVDNLMYYICDSEEEEYITSMVNTAIDIFELKYVMRFVEESDVEMFSETFLETLKEVLLDLEAYEHIRVVDGLINQKVGEK